MAEGGLPAIKPVTRVAAGAVIANPIAGEPRDDLVDPIPIAADLGEQLTSAGSAAGSRDFYGKSAIVGTSGISNMRRQSCIHAMRTRTSTTHRNGRSHRATPPAPGATAWA
jgi:hypothetical protein